MSKNAEQIKKEIRQLPRSELVEFRAWYEKFDADEWDRQIAEDVVNGKLDMLADAALSEHESGRSKRL